MLYADFSQYSKRWISRCAVSRRDFYSLKIKIFIHILTQVSLHGCWHALLPCGKNIQTYFNEWMLICACGHPRIKKNSDEVHFLQSEEKRSLSVLVAIAPKGDFFLDITIWLFFFFLTFQIFTFFFRYNEENLFPLFFLLMADPNIAHFLSSKKIDSQKLKWGRQGQATSIWSIE